jgi:hypothetical protein
MRENRTYGSEGREPGTTGLPYPYRLAVGVSRRYGHEQQRSRAAAKGAPASVFCQEGESPSKACTLRPLTESNCVLVIGGGEQLEVN